MSPELEYIIPEYLRYWYSVGPDKFIRVFWYFILFELTRYIMADFVIAGWYYLFRNDRKEKWEKARTAFDRLCGQIREGKRPGCRISPYGAVGMKAVLMTAG